MNGKVVTADSINVAILRPPEKSDWYCVILGQDLSDGVVYTPNKGLEPHAFWRLMHFLVLGFRWKKRA